MISGFAGLRYKPRIIFFPLQYWWRTRVTLRLLKLHQSVNLYCRINDIAPCPLRYARNRSEFLEWVEIVYMQVLTDIIDSVMKIET